MLLCWRLVTWITGISYLSYRYISCISVFWTLMAISKFSYISSYLNYFVNFLAYFYLTWNYNTNKFQANVCFLKALKISEKLRFFIPYKRNIYLKWVDKLSKSVKFTSNFFDVPIFKFTIDMVDSILYRTLGTFIPKVVL